MYLILENRPDIELAPIQRYGYWLHYLVGYIPEQAETRVDLNKYNATIVSEEVANAWKYAGLSRNFINVRPDTDQANQIFSESMEEITSKTKYYLTEQDFINTVLFMKIILTKILHTHYNRELEKLNLGSSNVEVISWSEQKKEAFAYMEDNTISTPVLSILAAERNITVEELANKVVQKVNEYNSAIAILLSKQQIVDQLIRNASNVKDMNRLMHTHFGIAMPTSQKEEEGITTEPEFNL